MSGEVVLNEVKADGPLMIDTFDTPYATTPSLREKIMQRGI